MVPPTLNVMICWIAAMGEHLPFADGAFDVEDFLVHGKYDHAHIGQLVGEILDQVETGGALQGEVDDGDVRGFGAYAGEAVAGVGGGADDVDVRGLPQQGGEPLADHGVIIDQENANVLNCHGWDRFRRPGPTGERGIPTGCRSRRGRGSGSAGSRRETGRVGP